MAVLAPGHDDHVLAARVVRRMDEIVDVTMQRELDEVPELFVTDDPILHEAVWRSTDDNMRMMIEAFRRPDAIPSVLLPGARLEADVTAQHGASADALLRTYRLGHQIALDYVIQEIENDGGAEIKRPLETLRRAANSLHEYMDAVVPMVASEFEDERGRLKNWPQLALLRSVQAVLCGDPSAEIGYSLAHTHVAVVAAGPGVGSLAREIADDHEDDAVVVELDQQRCWAWFPTPDTHHAVLERLAHAPGVCAGVGGPAAGHAGFVSAHRQAMLAFRVARKRGGVADLRSVALEAMALGDLAVAREVVATELGALVAPDGSGDRLRETVEAWFGAREHLQPTARALGVAPRTVSYRLRRAEDVLGYRIGDRRAELEMALRLHRLFADL